MRVSLGGANTMRFLVELYRYLILIFLVLTIVAVSFVVAKFAMSTGVENQMTGWMVAGSILGAIIVILSLGVTATFISMHDRLCDIATSTERLAARIERDPYVSE